MWIFTPKEIREFNSEMRDKFQIDENGEIEFSSDKEYQEWLCFIAEFIVKHKDKKLKFFSNIIVVDNFLKEINERYFDRNFWGNYIFDVFTMNRYYEIASTYKFVSNMAEHFFHAVALRLPEECISLDD